MYMKLQTAYVANVIPSSVLYPAPLKLVCNPYMHQVQFSTWMHNIRELIYVLHFLIGLLILSVFDGQDHRLLHTPSLKHWMD